MKKRFGDRFDGKLIRDLDSLHFIMPFIYPNRCDNEAYISQVMDLTAAEKYLEKKNKDNDGYHYTLFQLVITALFKTLILRPKMNRFIVNNSLYQRTQISASFAVKREFKDSGEEGLAFVYGNRADTLETIHDKMYREIYEARNVSGGNATEKMDVFNVLPRFIGRRIVKTLCWLERHGKMPESLTKGDPCYASVFVTNLGSIGMDAGYHHLANWGTNSIFVVLGEMKKRPFTDQNGKTKMKTSVDMGFTLDERIADGYYYSRTVKLFKYLLEHPEELEYRLDEKPHTKIKTKARGSKR
ncbi:MAG: 2-oxo acid dehydrogenase subunit E2 [Eubacterium sp.]|nr:2-oxo acid dehydrogenase subunit E2 [Eubacterium sp.]